MPELILDPIGYFLIRINKIEIEIAFCKYEDIKFEKDKKLGKNKINKKFSSKEPKEILEWIKKNNLVSREDHLKYLEKELKKAKECIKENKEYVQD